METLQEIQSSLPVTKPLPALFSTTPSSDLKIEEELIKNPQLTTWLAYLNKILDDVQSQLLGARGTASEQQLDVLGAHLATPAGRTGYARLVDAYERALRDFPTSYKLWKQYLDWRKVFVLGTPAKGKAVKLNAPKRKRAELESSDGERLLTLLREDKAGETDEGDRDVDGEWIGGLDAVVGKEEWKSLAGAYERALMCLPSMPRIWLDYLTLFIHPKCPAFLTYSHARRTFDRALRTLTGSLHPRIWRLYLHYAAKIGGPVLSTVWSRYLAVDSTLTEYYIELLLNQQQPAATQTALRASKLLLKLSLQASKGTYKSPEGKSGFHLLTQFLAAAERFPDEVGLSLEDVPPTSLQPIENDQEEEGSTQNGQADNLDEEMEAVLNLDNPAQIDVERVVRIKGIKPYPDQAGKLYVGLATFWTQKGEFDHARDVFEEGLRTVVTIRDFTTVFDAYAGFCESYISTLMESIASGDADADDEKEVDEQMQKFEALMDRRPFLVNEVLLRRNPNDVQEWEKRVVLWGNDDEKVDDTYQMATSTINPRKAVGNFHQLFLSWAKFFEQGGVSQQAEPDLASARKVFEKAVQVPFKKVDDLATVWCEWAQTEVRAENYDEALRVMARATAVPRKVNISFHDESLTSQARLFKSLKLWSFRADLEESLGTVESTKAVYDKIFELKIANAQMVVNCANFLEENEYFEEAFKVYERGIDLFTYPIRFELLNIYIAKFLARYKDGSKVERARDLFEDAIAHVPPKFAKNLFLMYAKMEEEFGLAKRAMKIYDRAVDKVDKKDQFEAFEVLIAKTAANFGLPATRPVYQRALESLPDAESAEMCLRFAALERKLGEIDRARAVYAHGSQFCDPRINPDYWSTWHAFELDTGSEDTFREYLRIKRSVQARFNTEDSYVRAAATAKRSAAPAITEPRDAMEALEGAQSASKPLFVAAQNQSAMARPPVEGEGSTPQAPEANADEIQLDE